MDDVTALIACDEAVLAADVNSYRTYSFSGGKPVKLKASPNGKLIAIFTACGKLFVMAMDFTRVISEYITKTSIPPDQLVWCGSDAVTLHWPGILLVIGPHGHSITYTVYRNAALISEIDGLRVITSTHHDVICRVPDFLVDVFSMGSKTPAAALHNAAECSFKDLKSTERLLELIGDNMSEAVQGCTLAACHASSFKQQSALLQAALLGLSHLKSNRRCRWILHHACLMIRVLNSIRKPNVGIPLTYVQHCHFGLRILVARLVYRKNHLLASRICKLSKGLHHVTELWASSIISIANETSDDKLMDAISAKFTLNHGSTYVGVATEAHSRGKTRLTKQFLELEPKSSMQVCLTNCIAKDTFVLAKAIESRDADLICRTLFHLQCSATFQDLASMLSGFPLAKVLFASFFKRTDIERLKSFYYSSGESQKGAHVLLREAFCSASDSSMQKIIWDANTMHMCGQTSVMYRGGNDEFHVSALVETQGLLKTLIPDLAVRAVSPEQTSQTSLRRYVKSLFLEGSTKEALQLSSDVNMSLRHVHWVHAEALAHKHAWRGLELLARDTHSHISCVHIIELCQRYGAPKNEISKHIARISDVHQKVELYREVGLVDEAQRLVESSQAKTFATKAVDFFQPHSFNQFE